MSAKMLLSGFEALQAQQKHESPDRNTHTAGKRRAEQDRPHCDPRDKVFNITEILENILEYLPAKTLFAVQRVNKRFHRTISGSAPIQRKMFLRIDNDHSIVWSADYMGKGKWCVKQVPPERQRTSGVVTPVALNPCLERVRLPRTTLVNTFSYPGEEVALSCRRKFTFQQFKHQSILKGFFSEPQSRRIRVKLCFDLGDIASISVSTDVRSDAPLTIGAVITRTMETPVGVYILWRRPDGQLYPDRVFWKGVPRELIHDLQHQTGLQVLFTPSDSTFHLEGVVAPTDDERVAANSGGVKGNGFEKQAAGRSRLQNVHEVAQLVNLAKRYAALG